MVIRTKCIGTAAVLLLLGCPLVGGTQTREVSLEDFVLQTVIEAESLNTPTIGEWTVHHPGESVETPAEKERELYQKNVRDMHDKELQGRWCLRSTAQLSLADGVSARRIALFYQPLVGEAWDKPVPPLPTESGDVLRRQGCRLARILYEFDGLVDAQRGAETVAKVVPGERPREFGDFNDKSQDAYWRPVKSFSDRGYYYLFVHNPEEKTQRSSQVDQSPAVLLEWEVYSLEIGPPGEESIDPEAGQPWFALRAAKLARLPKGPTLDMLSILAPQNGDRSEQPPLHCRRRLVPVVRRWMGLAAKSAPKQHAAALLLANEVLGRLEDCDEFADSDDYVPSEADGTLGDTDETLRKDLNDLGIETWTSARPGPEQYAGNLLKEVPKLAPTGPVNELYRMAILNDRCGWSPVTDMDCTDLIKEGESFLSTFPPDEWTPSVHLILAEAYAITAADTGDIDYHGTPDPDKALYEKKASEQYRAWYAKSTNQRDRALVWQEIWALDAGMGPWLNVPSELPQ